MKAIDYFLSKGHTEIGFIGGTYHDPNTDTEKMDIRERKFRRYMEEKGMLNENYIFRNRGFSVENGYNLMKKAILKLEDQFCLQLFSLHQIRSQ